jgi:CDP-4-dehydro-6-deoxyglucose reductase
LNKKDFQMSEYNIHVANKDFYFKCGSDQSVLDASKAHDLGIPYSCESGRCEACQKNIIDTSSETLKRVPGLACKMYPTSDMTIETPEKAKLPKIYKFPAKLSDINTIAPNIVRIKLRYPPSQIFDMQIGQHVNLKFSNCNRKYSIETLDQERKTFTILVKLIDNGIMSDHLSVPAP